MRLCVFVVTLPFFPSYPHRTTSLLPVRNCPRGVGNRGARGTAGVGVRRELRGRVCKLQIACLEGDFDLKRRVKKARDGGLNGAR